MIEPSLPPGPRVPPFLQAALLLLAEDRLMVRGSRRYGSCFTLRLPRLGDTVFVTDPGSAARVFHASSQELGPQEGLDAIYGAGSILLQDGDRHRELRKALLSALRGAAVDPYRSRIAGVVARLCASWPARGSFALLPRMRRISLEAILACAFGLGEQELDDWSERFAPMLAMVTSRQMTLRYLVDPTGGAAKWRAFQRSREECLGLVDREIERAAGSGSLAAPSFLDTLVTKGGCDTAAKRQRLHLRDQLLTLIIGAYDAPAITLSWAFDYLLRNPEEMRRLRGEAGEPAGEAYAKAVIEETLRLRPPVSFVARQVRSPFALGDHLLPPGTLLVPYLTPVHCGRAGPPRFEPSRLLAEKAKRERAYPFGGGGHSCIGVPFAHLSLQTILLELARRVDLVPAASSEAPRREAATTVPARGCRVKSAAPVALPLPEPVPALSPPL